MAERIKKKANEGAVLEEYYTIIKEPGARCVDHVTPDDGSACFITEEIVHCTMATNSVDTLQAVFCDDSAVDTGRVGGVIKRLKLF